MTINAPSQHIVSDHLAAIYDLAQEIDNCLLLGEKVTMISEAGMIYNHLRSIITPPYLTDDEYAWLQNIAIEWNNETIEYNRQMNGHMTDEQQDNLSDLQDDIRRAIDELMGRDGEHYELD